MRVFKHYSPIAWFVVLSASSKDPTMGKRVLRFIPEHPSTSGMGAEADDWPSLNFLINSRIESNILNSISIA